MAVLFTIGGLELELISIIIGLFLGYVIGHMVGKYRGMMGGFGGMSDKNLKTDIKSFDSKEFLDSLDSYTYKFKNPAQLGAAEGQRYGVMAQDLEKTDAGKSIVVDTRKGKMVDAAQGFGLVLASLSDINKRLDKLEEKYKAK